MGKAIQPLERDTHMSDTASPSPLLMLASGTAAVATAAALLRLRSGAVACVLDSAARNAGGRVYTRADFRSLPLSHPLSGRRPSTPLHAVHHLLARPHPPAPEESVAPSCERTVKMARSGGGVRGALALHREVSILQHIREQPAESRPRAPRVRGLVVG
eukprot:Rhum_TRINITY_DN12795_c0_g2::Rhum_TRINITY_DN12795_c0_g2_i1::g.54441::m.54441